MRGASSLVKKAIGKKVVPVMKNGRMRSSQVNSNESSTIRETRSRTRKSESLCSTQIKKGAVAGKQRAKKQFFVPSESREMISEDSCSFEQLSNSTAFTRNMSSSSPMQPASPQSAATTMTSPQTAARVHTLADYAEFLEVPVYQATTEDFSDPFKLIETLVAKGFAKAGAVKILPPKSWKTSFSFPNLDKKFPTRSQVINDLSKGKPFDETKNSYNFTEFKKHAEAFSRTYKFQTHASTKSKERKHELEFWSIVDNPDAFKDVKVDYAADLSSKYYGSCFEVGSQAKENNDWFNLTQINSAKNSLFQPVRKRDSISGINIPWVYFGMLFSTFCFHVEDMYMYSLNYMHDGSAKSWYIIPESHMNQFEDVYKKTYKDIIEKDRQAMSAMNLQLNPMIALKAGIPVYRADQHAGQFILTFPKAYHGGFSHGFNCGEAVNLITPSWIKYYYEAKVAYQKQGFSKLMPFPLAYILTSVVLDSCTGAYDLNFLSQVNKDWEKMIGDEIAIRAKLISDYKTRIRQKQYTASKENYQQHICCVCKEYCYLSYIQCNKCLKQSCSSHVSPCYCLQQPVSLFIRFTEKEFAQQKAIISDAIQYKTLVANNQRSATKN